MAIRPLNLKNQVKTLKIYPVKWSDYGSKSKARLIERPSNFAFSLKNVRSPAFLNRHFSLQIQKAGTPNKNTNKLIRQFLPKSARLDVIDDEQIQQVEDYLNNRPRKVLGF